MSPLFMNMGFTNPHMKNRLKKIKITLGLLIAVFLLIVSFFVVPMPDEIRRPLFLLAAVLGIAFFVLGVILLVMTIKSKVKSPLKWFLIMTGASSAAVFPSVILHNLVYGLLIYLGGPDVGDEAFFFILALMVCPIVFLVGAVGSVVLMVKKK